MQMYTLHYNEFETPDKVKTLQFDAPLKKPDLIWIQMEILFFGSWRLFKSFLPIWVVWLHRDVALH